LVIPFSRDRFLFSMDARVKPAHDGDEAEVAEFAHPFAIMTPSQRTLDAPPPTTRRRTGQRCVRVATSTRATTADNLVH
jgi:hypothetical protein